MVPVIKEEDLNVLDWGDYNCEWVNRVVFGKVHTSVNTTKPVGSRHTGGRKTKVLEFSIRTNRDRMYLLQFICKDLH